VDADRVVFLFDTTEPPFDLDDEDALIAFFSSEVEQTETEAALGEEGDDFGASIGRFRALFRMIVASQILHDTPPEIWQTVQRLSTLGLARDDIWRQLMLALTYEIRVVLGDEESVPTEATFKEEHYASLLARLPAANVRAVVDALTATIADDQGLSLSNVQPRVLARLGRSDDELSAMLVDEMIERGLDEDGALFLLAGDRCVHVPTLCEDIVLTHRLEQLECDTGVLSCVSNDLAGFAWYDDLSLPDGGEVEDVFSMEPGHIGWQGPDGWLDGLSAGDLIAVSVNNGVVRLEHVADAAEPDDEVTARLRRVYDAEAAERELPVTMAALTFGLLADNRATFAHPRPPVSELCARTGLEVRGAFVAHDETMWRAQERRLRSSRVHDACDDDCDHAHRVLAILDAAENLDASREDLRAALADLRDETLCELVLDELVDPDEPAADDVARAQAFGAQLVDAAVHAREKMMAHWVSGIVAERARETLAAEAHFELAFEADRSWGPLIDRLAWYRSDRGDAPRAVQLWRMLEDPDWDEVGTVDEFAHARGPKVGRNDPCWCGSGRKFKVCHLGVVEQAPLPDRVGWLCRKATGYLVRHGGEAAFDVTDLGQARAVDPTDRASVAEAFEDPIVIDAALTEGGWFERFLADRGPLLPEDESLLAATWLLVDRTVYEIDEVRRDEGFTVRDVRTGDRLAVRELSMSRRLSPGVMVCGRAVPDSESHQFIGSVFAVDVGRVNEVLELCDRRDPHALCRHVAARHRPPRIVTREGEPIVACTAKLRVPDPRSARDVLDEVYESSVDGWVEMHDISDDERILRAQLRLDDATLTVVTHSEARADRVIARVQEVIPGTLLVDDERVPLQPGELPTLPTPLPGAGATDDPPVRDEIISMMEKRWIRESIPALGGATPREAAADPTRRRELEQLLASFPEDDAGPFLSMRPSKLRALLGLQRTPD